jgi:Fur family ferric uptake transcriptional regulator
MKYIHAQEREQFRKLFRQERIDNFDDRFKILEVFLRTEWHITVEELVDLLAQDGLEMSPEFVRDTLKLMCRFGFASKNRFDNGVVRYEHRHLGKHHDHLVCTKCRKIFEFEDHGLEQLQIRIAAAHGFHMLQHRMEIYGICSECLKDRLTLMPLSAAKPGEKVVIQEISGGAGVRMRLLTMGLRLGDRIEIITNHHQGQMAIAADFKRYVLGHGLAEKILVQVTEG